MICPKCGTHMSAHEKYCKKCSAPFVSNLAQSAANQDVVQRYGAGIKEHIVAYDGHDYENGTTLKRSLDSISKSKRGDPSDPYYKANTKQQAGFSAEVKHVARDRAEQAVAGKTPTTVRTDDIPGHVNDQLFDITTAVDQNGDPIPGMSSQMKFVGSNPSEAVKKLTSKDFQKYVDNDVKIMVPSDHYDGMKEQLGKKISGLESEVKQLKAMGKVDAAKVKQAQLDKCKKIDKNLVKSNVSTTEAIEARNTPLVSTVKDIGRMSHRAGREAAKNGAMVVGSLSIARNAIAVIRGEKELPEATADVALDTLKGTAVSYATGAAGAAIKGTMQHASGTTIRALSKTNLPAYIVTATVEISKTMHAYFSGEIDGGQCLTELGEKGYCTVASSLGATIGQVAIPIPVVGAVVGGMIGYSLAAASYGELLTTLENEKLAKKERIRIQKECAEAIVLLKQCRAELEQQIAVSLNEKTNFFNDLFTQIHATLNLNDVDGYIDVVNSVSTAVGKRPLFATRKDCDDFMMSSSTLVFD